MKAIEYKNISKNFGNTKALNNINLNIDSKDIYGLVGPNGAGKSTILKILAGHIIEDSGEVKVFDIPLNQIKNKKSTIGFLIEKPAFYSYLSGEKNLKRIAELRGFSYKSNDPLIKEFKMEDNLNKKVKSYSTGMVMRLGLIAAFMGKPKILILDEPINGLDPEGIIDLRRLLLKINREWNTTIVISSHILSELSMIATKFGFIKKGQVIEEINKEEIDLKSRNYIDIITIDKDLEKVVNILERNFNIKEYRVYPENEIKVFENFNSQDLQKILAKENIFLKSISDEKFNLENYYINLVEGKNEIL